MSTCIIIDDEFPSREELKYFIQNFSRIKVKEEFENPVDAVSYLFNNSVDIVFLDINMPNIDGVELAKIINNKDKDIKIVFITAYREYAVDAFELEAFDYILKPYAKERMVSLLKKLEKSSKRNEQKGILSVWHEEKIVILKTEEICYCESEEGQTYIVTEKGRYMINVSLAQLYKRLDDSKFFRSHRAFIINTDKIKEITPWFNNTFMIKIYNIDKEIPVSRNNISDFKQLMGIK